MDIEEMLNEALQGDLIKLSGRTPSCGFSKKEIRAAKKRRKQFKKALVKYAKTWNPYDWYHIVKLVGLAIEDMYDYYNEGVDVYQEEKSRQEILDDLYEVKRDWELLRDLEEGEACTDLSAEEFWKLEERVTKHMFRYIGENMLKWWD